MLWNCGVGRRLLRVPWTAKRSNQSILKEINSKYSLEGLVLKLKLQYFGHLMWRAGSLENNLMLGKIEGKRRRGQQRMRWLDSLSDSMDMNLSKLWEIEDKGSWCAAVYGITKSRTRLSDWTTTSLGRGIRRSMAQRACLTTLELLLYKEGKSKIHKISKTDLEMCRWLFPWIWPGGWFSPGSSSQAVELLLELSGGNLHPFVLSLLAFSLWNIYIVEGGGIRTAGE